MNSKKNYINNEPIKIYNIKNKTNNQNKKSFKITTKENKKFKLMDFKDVRKIDLQLMKEDIHYDYFINDDNKLKKYSKSKMFKTFIFQNNKKVSKIQINEIYNLLKWKKNNNIKKNIPTIKSVNVNNIKNFLNDNIKIKSNRKYKFKKNDHKIIFKFNHLKKESIQKLQFISERNKDTNLRWINKLQSRIKKNSINFKKSFKFDTLKFNNNLKKIDNIKNNLLKNYNSNQ